MKELWQKEMYKSDIWGREFDDFLMTVLCLEGILRKGILDSHSNISSLFIISCLQILN